MFSTLPKTNFNFSSTFDLSSANAFNLDQFKNLSFGNELTLSNNRILDWSKLKAFADVNLNVAKKMSSLLDTVENIVVKGENAGNHNFPLFPQCFPKPSS